MIEQANAASAASDAKTVRLKALRLAKEAADKEAGLSEPVAPKRVVARKRTITVKA